MEKKVASFEEYEMFMADKSCLNEVANFVVRENFPITCRHLQRTKSRIYQQRYRINKKINAI